MSTERIGTDRHTVACCTCGNTEFDVPGDRNSDPIIKCICGHVVGPYWALAAMAVGEALPDCKARVRPFYRPHVEDAR
jgi:hypothetical protein